MSTTPRTLHCWMSYSDWLQEDDIASWTELVAEYSEELPATCLLPDGHAGPHKFTADKDIEIREGFLP